MNGGYRNKCLCIYSSGAFLWLKILINFENQYTGGWLIFFFAWDFRGFSQTAAKHTTTRNKFDSLANIIKDNIDILIISKTKVDDSFPDGQCFLDRFGTRFSLDQNTNVGVLCFS